MAETIDLKSVRDRADSIYEAVIMIARRARQINAEQRQMMERETFDEMGDFDDDFEKVVPEEREADFPKPSSEAMEQFMNREIIREYVEDKKD